MVERVRNVIKRDKKKGVKRVLDYEEGLSSQLPKRKPKQSDLLRRYPLISTSSSSSVDAESLSKQFLLSLPNQNLGKQYYCL